MPPSLVDTGFVSRLFENYPQKYPRRMLAALTRLVIVPVYDVRDDGKELLFGDLCSDATM